MSLKSFVNALAVALDDVWGWRQDPGLPRPATVADWLIDRWIEILDGPPVWPDVGESSVLVLPPQPSGLPGGTLDSSTFSGVARRYRRP